MQDACTEFVDSCEHCQRMKNRTQRAFGTMAEVEEPESMGIAYSVDFLTRLAPATAGGFDCLMVIVDRWSRRVFTIPCHATTTAQKAAEIFYEEICLHQCRGIPGRPRWRSLGCSSRAPRRRIHRHQKALPSARALHAGGDHLRPGPGPARVCRGTGGTWWRGRVRAVACMDTIS